MQQQELQQRCAELHTALLQAQARIDVQTQALTETAEELDRGRQAGQRIVALTHRNEALEAELRVTRRQLGEANGAVAGRDAAWSTHHSLEDAMFRNAEAAQVSEATKVAEVNGLRDELLQAQEATTATALALTDARKQADRWRAQLEESEERYRALDSRCVAQQTEIENGRKVMNRLREDEKAWRRERQKLYREVDKNTGNAIRRREELYFTRTSLLKEALRLRSELERKPLPEAESGPDVGAPPPLRPGTHAWELPGPSETRHEHDAAAGPALGACGSPRAGEIGDMSAVPPTPTERQKILEKHPESPRERRLRTPTARPSEPPPTTFVFGLSPRAPGSLDNDAEFQEQLRACQTCPAAVVPLAGRAAGRLHSSDSSPWLSSLSAACVCDAMLSQSCLNAPTACSHDASRCAVRAPTVCTQSSNIVRRRALLPSAARKCRRRRHQNLQRAK